MPQMWLRPNTRAIAAGFLVPAMLLPVGLVLALAPVALWMRLISLVPIGSGLVIAVALWRMLRQPRLAYEDAHLLVYLSGSFQPHRVPIQVVECFFLGQAPSLLPNPVEHSQPSRTQAIVIRLAEAATEWHHRPVRRELGQWCEGYITVRGTWSEPIRPALVQELNAKLVAAHREQRERQRQVQQ